MQTWTALRLRDVTRVDMMVDPAGEPWVPEVTVSPGMTETSLLPMGEPVPPHALTDLCDTVTRSALGRRA